MFVIAANSEAILVNTTTNSDYVLVIANNTNPDTIPVSEFEKRDNSLQPENDKTDAFVNKFFVPEPSAEDEDTNEDRKVFPLPELKFSKLPKLPKFPSIFPPRKIIVYLTTTEVQHVSSILLLLIIYVLYLIFVNDFIFPFNIFSNLFRTYINTYTSTSFLTENGIQYDLPILLKVES